MLPLKFYHQDTLELAQNLLGKMLIRQDGNTIMKAMIVETEAYIGKNDSACHASKGRTTRTDIMFQRAGHAYVYFIYGMHYMLNIVTEAEGCPAAVLIRAAEPMEGQQQMQINRKTNTSKLCNGPAKLCKAMNITKAQNKLDLCDNSELWLEEFINVKPEQIQTSPRIGIGYADEEDQNKHWRFFVKDNPHVSK